MDLGTLTAVHTGLSIIAIVAGVPAINGLFKTGAASFWTSLFLVTAIATSVTGFFFPFNGLLPSHVVGIIALLILAVALYARYGAGLAGSWRWIYAVTIIASQYLLIFVAIAQAFLKIPTLKALAPTQSEPPFAIAQIIAFAFFVVLGFRAARKSPPAV